MTFSCREIFLSFRITKKLMVSTSAVGYHA